MQPSNHPTPESTKTSATAPGFEIRAYKKPEIRRQIAVVLSAFFLNFSGCGLLFCWGIYQSLYEELSLEEDSPFFSATSAEITLIGSISASLMKLCAPFAVAWCKQFSPQAVICAGGILYGLASLGASFGTKLWHFYLAQGVLIGIAACLSYMPSMVVPPGWFDKRRSLSMGIISAGTGIGGLVWSPILTTCFENMGFRNTIRLTGGVCTIIICCSSFALGWDPKTAAQLRSEREGRSLLTNLFYFPHPSKAMVISQKFTAQSLNATFQSAAYYVPVFYIASYSRTLGYSSAEGSNFTALGNACNAIGKICVGYLADHLGTLKSFFLTTIVSSAATMSLWVSSAALGDGDLETGKGLFLSFTVIYGLFASAYIGIFSPALISIFGQKEQLKVVGFMYMLQGAAGLAGSPIAGALIQGKNAHGFPTDYLGVAIFTGSLMLCSSLCTGWAWLAVVREHAHVEAAEAMQLQG